MATAVYDVAFFKSDGVPDTPSVRQLATIAFAAAEHPSDGLETFAGQIAEAEQAPNPGQSPPRSVG